MYYNYYHEDHIANYRNKVFNLLIFTENHYQDYNDSEK